jgi:hypothetical protein
MPLVHGAEDPMKRFWNAILKCGGTDGEKVTVPLKPAVVHAC